MRLAGPCWIAASCWAGESKIPIRGHEDIWRRRGMLGFSLGLRRGGPPRRLPHGGGAGSGGYESSTRSENSQRESRPSSDVSPTSCSSSSSTGAGSLASRFRIVACFSASKSKS